MSTDTMNKHRNIINGLAGVAAVVLAASKEPGEWK